MYLINKTLHWLHHGTEHSGGSHKFDPWSGVLYDQSVGGGGAGYYPTVTPHGGHAQMTPLMRRQLQEMWLRMQNQAHSRADSNAGGGGGTSTAPERLVLHGMKHPFDMVAMSRVG